jgi:hypothetical protein
MKSWHDDLKRINSRAAFLLFIVAVLLAPFPAGSGALAQKAQDERPESHSTRPRLDPALEMAERAMSAACSERRNDPLGSVPIDEMQARPSLPLAHPESVAGLKRAEKLLPVARELTIAALRELAAEYRLEEWRTRAAASRIRAVWEIEPDMDLRDNASVAMRTPHTIHFGTIFLAGLRSEEGMISVLAHEITHIADGKEDALHPLFRQVGRRASGLLGMRITGQRAEELTCDLVGQMVARLFIERQPNREPLARRLSRSIAHNCVDDEDTDDDHLSPRNTMRALFVLDPTLARDVGASLEAITLVSRPR